MNFYNEIDPKGAEWLRNLIAQDLIPAGVVDERSICELDPEELSGYRQCHFFAGIGGWSLAARLAGIPDDAEWDSGSCPCQPFSDAGAGLGIADERHLWPAFFRIIQKRRPRRVVGEQVASKMALGWLDGVFADLEGADYACWAQDLCSAGVDSPNLRQRLYWVAHAQSGGQRIDGDASRSCGHSQQRLESGSMANANGGERGDGGVQPSRQHGQQQEDGIAGCGLGYASGTGGRRNAGAIPCAEGEGQYGGQILGGVPDQPVHAGADDLGLGHPDDKGSQGRGLRSDGDARLRTPWSSGTVLIPCSDGKQRRIGPGVFPLVAGIPSRVGPLLTALRSLGAGTIKAARANRTIRLRGYGNAINPYVAAEFLRTCF